MSKIIKFPKKVGRRDAQSAIAPAPADTTHTATEKASGAGVLSVIGNGLVKVVWVVMVLVWPVLKWMLSIITFFQFLRMILYWHTPGAHAGWSFLAYFAALTAITYFVSVYKPKGL